MKFEVGDVVKLTKTGWTNSFHRDSGISPGAVAIVKAIMGGAAMFACEFFPPARSTYLHDCNGTCACRRGRWMLEYEIEPASLPLSANIAELFEEV